MRGIEMSFHVEISFNFLKGIPLLKINRIENCGTKLNDYTLKGWKEINDTMREWLTYRNMVDDIQSWENAYRMVVKTLLENGWERECYLLSWTKESHSGLLIRPPYIPCIDWRYRPYKTVLNMVILKDDEQSWGYNFIELDLFDIPLEIVVDDRDIKRLNLKVGEKVKVVFQIGNM